MELEIKILPEGEKKWYPMECEKCGWIGSGENAGGGGPIADTGDYNDPFCPCCFSNDVNETDNLQPLTGWVERLNKATALVKTLTEKIEGCDCSKHIYGHYEQENRDLHKLLIEANEKIELLKCAVKLPA